MQRDVQALSGQRFDLLVVGGGVNGLAAAYDAALRGLSVALIERADFGSGASASMYKILHGGLRYLQHADFGRMRASIRERSWFFRAAPHLVRPLGFLVPTYGHGLKGREAMAVALRINDWMGGGRNRDLPPGLHLPKGRMLSRAECLEMAPMIPEGGLTAGALFYDGQVQHTDRMNLALATAAVGAGAVLVNYCEATDFVRGERRIEAVEARDVLGGGALRIEAEVVADMTGPWCSMVAEGKREVRRNGGFQMITRSMLEQEVGLAVISEHIDADAVIRRGGRHYFATPWRGRTMWGTTDKVFCGDPDDWRISQRDVEAFVAELDAALPGMKLEAADVEHVYGGLRPVGGEGGVLSRKHEIVEHGDCHNLISVEGVKYTTCRLLAEHTVDVVLRKLGKRARACVTYETKLPGGDVVSMDALRCEAREGFPGVDAEELEDLLVSYGSAYRQVLEAGGEDVLGARIRYAVAQEMAVQLGDVVLRRTGLGTLGEPDVAVLQRVAREMGSLLGWGEAEEQRQVDEVCVTYRLAP